MATEPGFSALLERYRKLSAADRKAVIAHLSADERDALKQASQSFNGTPNPSATASRQYAGYSGWLAERVQQAATDSGETPDVTLAGRAAIIAAHKSTETRAREEPPLARLLRRLGLLLNAGPEEDRA